MLSAQRTFRLPLQVQSDWAPVRQPDGHVGLSETDQSLPPTFELLHTHSHIRTTLELRNWSPAAIPATHTDIAGVIKLVRSRCARRPARSVAMRFRNRGVLPVEDAVWRLLIENLSVIGSTPCRPGTFAA